jgi:phosphoribosylanthranilate isomerase
VASAIQIVAPAAVDTASGVESEPGKKDKTKMQNFVLRAKNALSNLRLK